MKTIEEYWTEVESNIPNGSELSDAERRALRSIFYTGGISVFSMLSHISKAVAVSGESPETALHAVADELAMFIHESVVQAAKEAKAKADAVVAAIDEATGAADA